MDRIVVSVARGLALSCLAPHYEVTSSLVTLCCLDPTQPASFSQSSSRASTASVCRSEKWRLDRRHHLHWRRYASRAVTSHLVKGKGTYTWYIVSLWNTTSEALRYGTCSQGISQFYLHTHTFIRSRNEPYLPLPSQPQLVLLYRPRRDERLSCPGWLVT